MCLRTVVTRWSGTGLVASAAREGVVGEITGTLRLAAKDKPERQSKVVAK